MSLLDMVQGSLGQSAVGQISQQLGVSPSVAQTAIAAAIPMILGGMAGHASSETGAQQVQQAAAAHADVLDNAPAILQSGPPVDVGGGPGGLLGRILGTHRQTVEQGVQQASGLDPEKARRLLLMLTPLVLGALARRQFGAQGAQQGAQQGAPADPQQLGDALRQEAQEAHAQVQRQAPHVGGLLGKILDLAEGPRT